MAALRVRKWRPLAGENQTFLTFISIIVYSSYKKALRGDRAKWFAALRLIRGAYHDAHSVNAQQEGATCCGLQALRQPSGMRDEQSNHMNLDQ